MAPTEIYTLSLHDALPISISETVASRIGRPRRRTFSSPERTSDRGVARASEGRPDRLLDRKSTRLNSSHRCISYAVFCLKKKTKRTHYSESWCRQSPSNRR